MQDKILNLAHCDVQDFPEAMEDLGLSVPYFWAIDDAFASLFLNHEARLQKLENSRQPRKSSNDIRNFVDPHNGRI